MNNKASGEKSAAQGPKESRCWSRGTKKKSGNNISHIHNISWATLRAGALCTVSRTQALILFLILFAIICPRPSNTPLARTVGCNYMGRVAVRKKCPETMCIVQNKSPIPEPSAQRAGGCLAGLDFWVPSFFKNQPQRKIWDIRSRGVGCQEEILECEMWSWGNAWDW